MPRIIDIDRPRLPRRQTFAWRVLIALVPMLAPTSATSAVFWHPQKLYAGMNVVTISASTGIARLEYRSGRRWREVRRGVALANVRVASVPDLKGCPTKGSLYLYVPRVTERAALDFRITECDGRTRVGRLSYDVVWNVEHVPMGAILPGETVCARLRVTNEGGFDDREYTLDRIVSQSPLFRVVFTGRRPPVTISAGATYHYNVCVTGGRPGTYRLPIHVYIRRDQPAGGFTSFIVADTVSVTVRAPARRPAATRPRAARRPAVVAPAREPASVTPPRPAPVAEPVAVRELSPPEVPPVVEVPVAPAAVRSVPAVDSGFLDPTTFRVMLMPTARPVPDGELAIASYDVAGLLVAYGASERLTLTAGGIFIPDALGEQIADIAAGARYEVVHEDYWRLAGGLLYNFSRSDSSSIQLLAPYVVASLGDEERRLSVVTGFTRRRHAPGSDPAYYRSAAFVAVGGDLQWAPRWKIVGEFYSIAASDYQPVALTVRHFGENWALDVGGAVNLGIGGPKVAPVVAFVWMLGGD